jgi:protein-S-isoprenylcysteine O-methyltransferase Ste14
MKKPFTTIAAVIFVLMALVHIFRLAFGWEIMIERSVVPMWVSVLGVIIAGGLAVMLWRESR